MPSPPVIDLDELLAPIPGDSPAGGSVPFAVREKLEEFRKEVDPSDFRPDDPMRPESAQKADWAAVVRLARETLIGTSKDLLVTARLTEALTKEHGFGGLRDGLRLMRRLVSECWDRLNPAIESEDDLEIRAAPFFWLDEADRGARFPTSLRQVPMIWGEGGRYGWFHWKQSQSGKDGLIPGGHREGRRGDPARTLPGDDRRPDRELAGARHPGQGAQREDRAVRPGLHRPAPGRGRMPGAGPADPATQGAGPVPAGRGAGRVARGAVRDRPRKAAPSWGGRSTRGPRSTSNWPRPPPCSSGWSPTARSLT